MLKVALLHYSSPPIVGGVESVIAHHARLMADDSFQVEILAGRGKQTDPRIRFIHIPLMDSRQVRILEIKKQLDKGVVPDEFYTLVEQLISIFEEHLSGKDLIIAHNIASLNKNLPLTAALEKYSQKAESPPLILWHHDLAWTTPRYQSELHPGFPWDLLKSPWNHVTQVVVSALRQQELANLYAIPLERIFVIPNGLDIPQFFKFENTTKLLSEKLNLMKAAPLLLLPVRITPRKNIELALRALIYLREIFPQAVLVVTGPLGPHNPANVEYFSQLTNLRRELHLAENAFFLADYSDDYLPDEVIADFYRLADALILPSKEEGFGIPVLEAGISGIPIFCSDIPPLRELGGDNAVYFSPDCDPQQAANLIIDRLFNDPVYNLRVSIRNEYSWERIYQTKISPLLNDVITKKR